MLDDREYPSQSDNCVLILFLFLLFSQKTEKRAEKYPQVYIRMYSFLQAKLKEALKAVHCKFS